MSAGVQRCPTCAAILDAHTSLLDGAAAPAPGDYSVCLYCGEILRFGPALQVRVVTPVDRLHDPELSPADFARLVRLQALVRRERGGRQ